MNGNGKVNGHAVLCDDCEKPIPKVRLKALPFTTVCVKCSTERPLTENDIDLDGSATGDMNSMTNGDERVPSSSMDRKA